MKQISRTIFSVVLFIYFVNCDCYDPGFLKDSKCTEASHCYIQRGELELACYYNVEKCACFGTIDSIYHLKYKNETGECLQSKYGPCGASLENPKIKVGCLDGFICSEGGRCIDPTDTEKKVKGTYEFSVNSCRDCDFSKDLQLECYDESRYKKQRSRRSGAKCLCKKVYIADARGTYWDIYNYDSNTNCSVSRFGPCGTKNGVKIDCQNGMKCIDGVCTNPNKIKSSISEPCQSTKNCEQGLICSGNYICIKPKSVKLDGVCKNDEECEVGLKCSFTFRFSPRICKKEN